MLWLSKDSHQFLERHWEYLHCIHRLLTPTLISSGTDAFNPGQNEVHVYPSDRYESDSTRRRIKRFPTAIVIGARKAGTRAVLRFVDLHPDVVTSKREPHFFDRWHPFKTIGILHWNFWCCVKLNKTKKKKAQLLVPYAKKKKKPGIILLQTCCMKKSINQM